MNFGGPVFYIDRSDINTDEIIPAKYLTEISKQALKPHLLEDLHLSDTVFDPHSKELQEANVLVTRSNFGCGSSREHAVWAMLDYGFRAVISTSFADIFFSNCFKNGLLPIVLEKQIVDQLFVASLNNPDYSVYIDLHKQQVVADGIGICEFDIDAFKKHCMLNGLDEIGITLQYKDKVHAYEDQLKVKSPWLFIHD